MVELVIFPWGNGIITCSNGGCVCVRQDLIPKLKDFQGEALRLKALEVFQEEWDHIGRIQNALEHFK